MRRANVDKKVINEGLEKLKSSMLMPLDFLKANKMNPEFSRQIEDAMISSYANLPKLKGKTLFIVDVSGSMQVTMSAKSDFSRYDAACAMAMLAANQCEDYEIVCTAGKVLESLNKSIALIGELEVEVYSPDNALNGVMTSSRVRSLIESLYSQTLKTVTCLQEEFLNLLVLTTIFVMCQHTQEV